MSNAWLSGQISKSVMSKKRPRWFWNVFFGSFIVILIGVLVYFTYPILCENIENHEEQIFLEYKDGCLVTDEQYFKIPKIEKQQINISTLDKTVEQGEKITVITSRVSGELLRAEYQGKTVYEKETTKLLPVIILLVFLDAPLLYFNIFMLIVTNMKKPGKRIAKIQKSYLLRFYK